MLGHIAHFFNRSTRVVAQASPLRACLSLLKGIRPTPLVLTAIIVLSGVISLIPASNASAAATCPSSPTEASGGSYNPKTGGCSPDDEATSISYFGVLSICVELNMNATITSDIGHGKAAPISAFFGPGPLVFTSGNGSGFLFPGAVKTTCADALTAALKLWGFTTTNDPEGTQALLESMGNYTYQSATGGDKPKYTENGSPPQVDTARATAFQTAIEKKVYGGKSPTISNAAKYAIALDAFTRSGKLDTNIGQDDNIAQCNAQDLVDDVTKPVTQADKNNVAAAKNNTIVKNDAAGEDYNFTQNVSASRAYTNLNLVDSTGTPRVAAYAYLQTKEYGISTAGILSAIGSGGITLLIPSGTSTDKFTHAETFNYNMTFRTVPTCATLVSNINTYAADFRDWQHANQGTLSSGSGTGKCSDGSTPAADKSCPSDTATQCVVDGIGWLVCPLMNALGGLNDALYAWVQSVLLLNPLQQTDSSGATTPQYQNWSIIRNIANVVLVIGFLVIIFSQISSIGISNYGIKKMLPRIILIAIAINLSWTIMTVSVDVVNILGVGLHSLLNATAVNATADNLSTASTVDALVKGAASITVGGVVAFFALPAAGIGVGTLVLLALPFILGAALSLLAAVATLFVRNALIIVLVIISPVAIAAALLPNTEQYFKSWRKMFLQMLLLFPMAALLFAGAKFAAYVVLTSNQQMAVIAALFIMAAPLGLLPWLASRSGGIMATVGGRLQGIAKSGQGALRKGLEQRVATSRAEQRSGAKNFWGARAYRKGANGRALRDRQGNKIPLADSEGTSLRTTQAQRWANRGQGLKEREGTAQKVIVSNYKQIGLRTDGSRASRRVANIIDAGKTEELRGKSVEAQYSARLEERQLGQGPEKAITHKLEDAEATSRGFQGRLKQEQAERIRDGAINTAAASINAGDPSILNLRDVSQQAYVAAAGTAAAEAQDKELNDNTGAADIYIQHENEAKFGSEIHDAEQKAVFDNEKNSREDLIELANRQDIAKKSSEAAEHELESKVEQTAESGVDTREEDRRRTEKAKEEVATIHANEEAELAARRAPGGDLYGLTEQQERSKLEKEKAEGEQERAFQERQRPADEATGRTAGDLAGLRSEIDTSTTGASVAKTQQAAELARRRAPDGDLTGLTQEEEEAKLRTSVSQSKEDAALQRRKATGDLVGLTEQEVRAKLDAENAQIIQKTAADKSKAPDGTNSDLAVEKIVLDSAASLASSEVDRVAKEAKGAFNQTKANGTQLFTDEQLAAVANNAEATIASGYAGNWAEGSASLNLDQKISEDTQGELARQAAGKRIELEVDAAGNPIPLLDATGAQRIDSNGRPMFRIRGNENIVARSFQRLAADTQGDADALKAQYEREGFATGTMLKNILDVDKDTGAGPVKPPAKDPDGNPIPGGIPIAEEVAVIQRIAESGDIGGGVSITEYVASLAQIAKQDQDALEADPNNIDLQKRAKASRERAKLVSNGMMNGFAKNSKGKPPWAGGSDEAKWIEGTHTDGPKQQVVNAFAGGKLSGDKLMGSNYEQLKPLNKFFEEIAQPGGIKDAISKAKADIKDADFPPGSPERAVEEARVEADFKTNFSATLLTLDDLLDNPKYANRLEPRQRTELERTRATFDQILDYKYDPSNPNKEQSTLPPDAPLQRPTMKDPKGRPVEYRRRTPEEYYTTPRPDADTGA
ncbi:hypothetical protein EPN95_02225 [Patescibacteria group bacterium]|nr:MAG: hypothetical protein EPN95_02225 [Patescibacteria group bacterium]